MGSMGKLSEFSGIKRSSEPVTESHRKADLFEIVSQPEVNSEEIKEKLVPINIKITKSQKTWLTEIAQQVRDNNSEPVAPSDRVYPQHLIGIAIDLLKDTDIDWSGIKSVEDLRGFLNL
ncbi:MAG: hypothetical protein N5P05_004635 (plasmid) [Chroococcopsis gigantea SAG 12.99]|nr:hypothetical protein [Chroococcopsis gigantea SAG 12.99]